MLFALFVFLHIAAMFVAVGLTYGPYTLFLLAIRGGQVSAVRAATAAGAPIAKIVPVFFGVGGILGLVAAIVSGANLLAPWLLIAYAIFIILSVIGFAYTSPTLEKVGKAVAASPDGPLSPDLRLLVERPGARLFQMLDFGLLFVVIFDMVFKPFS